MREGREITVQTARAVRSLVFSFAFGTFEGGMVREGTGFAQTHSNLRAGAVPDSTHGPKALELSLVNPNQVNTGCDSPHSHFASAISRPCLQRLLHHLSVDKGSVSTEG